MAGPALAEIRPAAALAFHPNPVAPRGVAPIAPAVNSEAVLKAAALDIADNGGPLGQSGLQAIEILVANANQPNEAGSDAQRLLTSLYADPDLQHVLGDIDAELVRVTSNAMQTPGTWIAPSVAFLAANVAPHDASLAAFVQSKLSNQLCMPLHIDLVPADRTIRFEEFRAACRSLDQFKTHSECVTFPADQRDAHAVQQAKQTFENARREALDSGQPTIVCVNNGDTVNPHWMAVVIDPNVAGGVTWRPINSSLQQARTIMAMQLPSLFSDANAQNIIAPSVNFSGSPHSPNSSAPMTLMVLADANEARRNAAAAGAPFDMGACIGQSAIKIHAVSGNDLNGNPYPRQYSEATVRAGRAAMMDAAAVGNLLFPPAAALPPPPPGFFTRHFVPKIFRNTDTPEVKAKKALQKSGKQLGVTIGRGGVASSNFTYLSESMPITAELGGNPPPTKARRKDLEHQYKGKLKAAGKSGAKAFKTARKFDGKWGKNTPLFQDSGDKGPARKLAVEAAAGRSARIAMATKPDDYIKKCADLAAVANSPLATEQQKAEARNGLKVASQALLVWRHEAWTKFDKAIGKIEKSDGSRLQKHNAVSRLNALRYDAMSSDAMLAAVAMAEATIVSPQAAVDYFQSVSGPVGPAARPLAPAAAIPVGRAIPAAIPHLPPVVGPVVIPPGPANPAANPVPPGPANPVVIPVPPALGNPMGNPIPQGLPPAYDAGGWNAGLPPEIHVPQEAPPVYEPAQDPLGLIAQPEDPDIDLVNLNAPVVRQLAVQAPPDIPPADQNGNVNPLQPAAQVAPVQVAADAAVNLAQAQGRVEQAFRDYAEARLTKAMIAAEAPANANDGDAALIALARRSEADERLDSADWATKDAQLALIRLQQGPDPEQAPLQLNALLPADLRILRRADGVQPQGPAVDEARAAVEGALHGFAVARQQLFANDVHRQANHLLHDNAGFVTRRTAALRLIARADQELAAAERTFVQLILAPPAIPPANAAGRVEPPAGVQPGNGRQVPRAPQRRAPVRNGAALPQAAVPPQGPRPRALIGDVGALRAAGVRRAAALRLNAGADANPAPVPVIVPQARQDQAHRPVAQRLAEARVQIDRFSSVIANMEAGVGNLPEANRAQIVANAQAGLALANSQVEALQREIAAAAGRLVPDVNGPNGPQDVEGANANRPVVPAGAQGLPAQPGLDALNGPNPVEANNQAGGAAQAPLSWDAQIAAARGRVSAASRAVVALRPKRNDARPEVVEARRLNRAAQDEVQQLILARDAANAAQIQPSPADRLAADGGGNANLQPANDANRAPAQVGAVDEEAQMRREIAEERLRNALALQREHGPNPPQGANPDAVRAHSNALNRINAQIDFERNYLGAEAANQIIAAFNREDRQRPEPVNAAVAEARGRVVAIQEGLDVLEANEVPGMDEASRQRAIEAGNRQLEQANADLEALERQIAQADAVPAHDDNPNPVAVNELG